MCAMIRFARLKPSGLVLLLATVSLEAQNRRHWRVGGVLRDAARAAGAEDLSTQESPRISGHTTSEYGESQVRGTIDDRAIAFTFEATHGGKAVVIRVTAKVEGARMRGTAKIGDRVDGAFTAERSDWPRASHRLKGLLHFPRFSLDGSCVTPHGADGRRQSGCGGPHGAGIFLVAFCMAPPGFASLIRLDHRARPNRQFWLCVDIAFRSDRSFACSVSWFSGSP